MSRTSPFSRFFDGRSMSKKKTSKQSAPSALRRESERALVQQIRRLLALPPEKRTNFLRVRLPNGGTSL